MPFIPVTEKEKEEMLRILSLSSLDQLFDDIPAEYRFPVLNVSEGLSEDETLSQINALASRNKTAAARRWFLGAGCYNHFIPAAVTALASRGEFLTAYTPYQSEVSQGTLQAIFEYQSMIAALFGMDVVNAGHYDGAAALAEAVVLALKNSGKDALVLLPEALHPEYRETLETYLAAYNPEIESYQGPPAAAAERAASLSKPLACLVAAYPDFFGAIPDLSGAGPSGLSAAETVHKKGGLFIVHADPIMSGLFQSPGRAGADIVTSEGQSLGNDMNFGGPGLGIMAVKKELMRKIPGRIAGLAKDSAGRRGFTLTLSAREQHIRRERAVSNICSNQGLAMLRACVYLALMGKNGLRETAALCWHKSHYAAKAIAALPGFAVLGENGAEGNFFREFVVKLPCAGKEPADAQSVFRRLLENKQIVCGLPLSRYFPEKKDQILVCVTERNAKAEIDQMVAALKEACAEAVYA